MWKSALTRLVPLTPAFALALALAPGALAQPAIPGTGARTLTMTGTGSVKAAPDMADISAGVSSEAPTAAAALAANNETMARILAALERARVPRTSIQTSNFSVAPVYGNRIAGEVQPLTGYRVNNDVHVALDDIARVGATLDALVAAGANQMNGLSFTFKDPAPLLENARAAAVADAQLRARQYAAAAGLALGPIQSLSEGGAEPPRPLFRALAMAPAAQIPVEAGEQSVNASVTIVWEIR